MDKNEKIFATVDIGSSKILVLVGRKNEEGKIQVIGIGHSASRGIKRGVILNLEEAFAAINEAIGLAEKDCGCYVEHVYVNISGQQLTTIESVQRKTFSRDHCMTEADVDQLLQMSRQINLEEGMAIYHVNPEFYTVDEETGITNPVGYIGEKIEARYKVHVAPESYERNIGLCFDRGSIVVDKAILDPIASSDVVLTDEEKETGVALIDIGGGTTKISIFYEGVLCYTTMVPFGGNVITSDIKEGCAITLRQAESLKIQFGQAIADFAPEEKVVTIPSNGWEPKQISFKSLAHIIQARMEDIIAYFFYAIRKSGYADKLGSGIVITGGTSLLPNLGQLIKFHIGYDVRVGKPHLTSFVPNKNVYDPRYSTALGLLKIASEDEPDGKRKKRKIRIRSNEPGLFVRMQMKIKQGVIEFFEETTEDTEMT